MKKFIFFLCVCSWYAATSKDDPKFPVSAIPEELKKDVNVVIRKKEIALTVRSQNKADYKVYQAITILNLNGKDYAREVLLYNKLIKVNSFKGAVYSANGELIKRLKASEIYDQSAFDGYSLYSDLRLKAADLSQGTYPYTVEYEYEINYNYLYSYGNEQIIPGEKISVEKFYFKVAYPSMVPMRSKVLNIENKLSSQKVDNQEIIIWSYENLLPIKLEPHGSLPAEMLPQILIAPSNFEYDGYVGNMKTWEDFGKWNLQLNKDRDAFSDITKNKIKELTKNCKSAEEKTKVLYEFLQSKTRYVSISLGIGGLQPFQAALVDQVGYGDCKALSNYMVALLKEVGIKGYYTSIKAGEVEPEVIIDFPSHQSNHIIVSVPNGVDTIWLECTSQTNPFGYIGRSTCDRKALMITENGGKLVNTPRYTADKNVTSTTAEVFVEPTGDAIGKIRTTYSGLQYEYENLDFYLNGSSDDQRKWLRENLEIPSFDINSFTMVNKKEKIPAAVVNVDLTLRRLANVSGKRLFITPNLMNRSSYVPEKVEARKTKVVRRMAYTDIDTIRYHLPEGVYPEFLPQPVSLKTRFGEYDNSFKLDQGNLLYIRRVRMNKGEFPPESYNELIEFFKNVNKADNTKIVFMSKT